MAERPLHAKAQGFKPCSSTHTKTTPWRNGQRIRLRIWGLRVRVPSELFAFARPARLAVPRRATMVRLVDGVTLAAATHRDHHKIWTDWKSEGSGSTPGRSTA